MASSLPSSTPIWPKKKRNSWGRDLPLPKTNLPPRKRAKTEDEKEQRLVERVLRNRRAAQTSRTCKRQQIKELESEKQLLERQKESLEQQLVAVKHENFCLAQNLAELTAQMEATQIRSLNPDIFTPTLERSVFDQDQMAQNSIIHSEFQTPGALFPNLDTFNTPRSIVKDPVIMLWDIQSLSPTTSTQPIPCYGCDPSIIDAYIGSDLDSGSDCAAESTFIDS